MFTLELSQIPGYEVIFAGFPKEPEPRRFLLGRLLLDMWGQEDLYLSYIARAEAGETTLDLYNNLVNIELHASGRVVVRDLFCDDEDQDNSDTPTQTELTLAEAKQLILDWLDAKAKWQAEHGPLNEGTVPDSR